jgi:hypothetical protein
VYYLQPSYVLTIAPVLVPTGHFSAGEILNNFPCYEHYGFSYGIISVSNLKISLIFQTTIDLHISHNFFHWSGWNNHEIYLTHVVRAN